MRYLEEAGPVELSGSDEAVAFMDAYCSPATNLPADAADDSAFVARVATCLLYDVSRNFEILLSLIQMNIVYNP